MFRDVTKIKQGIFERNLVSSVVSELSSSEFTLNLGLFLERRIILLNLKFSLNILKWRILSNVFRCFKVYD